MKIQNKARNKSNGFTIVEVTVTLFVVAAFLSIFFQMYLAIEGQRIAVVRKTKASDIAYTNLRKFATKPNITPATCISGNMSLTAASPTGIKLMDQTNTAGNPSAYGATTEDAQLLGAGVTQTVIAYAPYGCVTPRYTVMPIKLISTVSYNNNREVIVHVSYIK